MNIGEFISDNYVMIYELIGLEILLMVSAHISRTMKVRTLLAVFLLFMELVFFTIEKWTQSFPVYSMMRPMLTAALYSTYPLIIIALLQITTPHLSPKHLLLLMIPEIICVPLFFSSQWTHLVFYIAYPNSYKGGPLCNLPYYLFVLYVIIFLIHNFIYLKHSSRFNRVIMAYIIIGPLLGALFFIFLDIWKDYSSLFASGMLMYFAYIYIHMAKIDPLTGLLNRQSYYQDMEIDASQITGVISIDMNDLKYLNDTYGHQAGDEALKTVSTIFLKNSGRNSTVYRVGGDEFMVFYRNVEEKEIENAISKMRGALKDTDYICAFGYSMLNEVNDITEAIRISDKHMYEDKAEIKKVRNLNAMTDVTPDIT